MSKLDDLINKLCPDGVEYKTLDNIALIKARIGWQGLTKDEYLDSGDYYLVTGVDFKNGLVDWDNCHYVTKDRYDQDINIQIKNDDVLVTKDGTLGKVAFVQGLTKPATLNSGVFVIRSLDENICNKFLYHYLKSPYLMKFANSKLTGGTIKHLNQSVITQLPIPVPPLEVQNEIVRILDKFTSLEAELEAELEARRKQYEYYRDSLLTFGDDVEWKTLGEIATINRGVRVTRDMLSSKGEIPVYQNALAPLGYFDKSNRNKDTTFVISAGAAGQIGYSGIDFWAADDCFTFDETKNVISKYIFYYLQTKQNFIDSRVRRGSIPRISRDVFAKMSIPIPPIKEQQRIVSILDRFESLCNDITSGLPAEIEARHKQYEYYRDKLLAFKCKEA